VRILISTQYYWPEGFVINDLARLLVERGHSVTVLTGKPNYPQGDVYPCYRAWGTARETHDGVEIIRMPIVPRGQRSRIRLALNYLSFVVSAGLLGSWMLRRHKFDVIFVYGVSPLLQALPAIGIARLLRAPLVTWVQDLWPESLSATGYVRNRAALRLVSALVRLIYRASDRILIQSEAFRGPVEHYAAPGKIVHYPNPYVEQARGDASAAAQALAQRLSQGFSAVFAGNLGSAQALDSILGAAAALSHRTDIRIFLVGSGSEQEHVQREISRLGLNNVELCGRYPTADMGAILRAAGCLLVTLRDDPIFAYTVPSKVQAYLAAGRPIIAALNGEGARLVGEAGAGLAVSAQDALGLAAAIQTMADLPETERHAMGKNSRSYFEQHYTANELVDTLVAHLADVTEQEPQRR
jgi:glycosyltransferase involved in cell wall biosynthesis